MIAERKKQFHKIVHSVGIRSFMHSVKERKALSEHVTCNGFICRKHKLLYHCRSHIMLIRNYINRSSLFIKCDMTLGKIKIYGSAPYPHCLKDIRKLFHAFKHGDQFLIFFYHLFVMICEYLLYRSVCHAPVNIYKRLGDLIIFYITAAVNTHNAAHGKSVFAFIE